MSNRDRLQEAGLIRKGYKFSKHDEDLLESLSEEEVEALINVKRKLGGDFFQRNNPCHKPPPVGIVF